MFEIDLKVTFTAAPELIGVLQRLCPEARPAAPAAPAATHLPAPVPAPAQVSVAPTPIPAAATAAPAPTPIPAVVPTTAPAYSFEDLARAGGLLIDAGKGPEISAVLTRFGVKALPELPKEQYGAFATALRQMGGRI